MDVEGIEPSWHQTELLRRMAPTKAVEEYEVELSEILDHERPERQLEAIDWLLEREAEAIKEYLAARRVQSMIANARMAAHAATGGLDTPRPGIEHDAGMEQVRLDREFEEAGRVESKLAAEAQPHIERMKRLRRIRAFLVG
jgi:hypothetical protein